MDLSVRDSVALAVETLKQLVKGGGQEGCPLRCAGAKSFIVLEKQGICVNFPTEGSRVLPPPIALLFVGDNLGQSGNCGTVTATATATAQGTASTTALRSIDAEPRIVKSKAYLSLGILTIQTNLNLTNSTSFQG
jgi:hypothetical protein